MHTSRRTGSLTLGGLAAAGTMALLVTAAPAQAATEVAEPDRFTSAFTSMATPDQVVDAEGNAAPGEPGATGEFTFRVNLEEEIICYDITLNGVTGDYESPANTATHIHEAAAGESGPPRIAFPDPEPVGGDPRTSSGCLQGPFTTGVTDDDDVDTGEGFSLAQIEEDPAAFTADSHTADYVPGVVRGQLSEVPVGGVQTGGGKPGGAGPTVIAGHVDSLTGPTVFFRLTELVAGDRIHVTDVEGVLHDYEVYRVEDLPKDRFPTAEVFGARPADELRLITCTGVFDQDSQRHADNRVVFAQPVGA